MWDGYSYTWSAHVIWENALVFIEKSYKRAYTCDSGRKYMYIKVFAAIVFIICGDVYIAALIL